MIEHQILIVDSDKDFLRLCEHNFAELVPNSQVFTACNGVEALHQLDVHPCDLIIADCDLPEMNGLDFARAAHRLLPAAHILLMSAQDADRLDAIGAIGIARVFAVGGLEKRPFYSTEDPFCKTRTPNDQKWTIDHFYKKLLLLESKMNTKSAKIEAKKRTKILKNFLKEL